MSVVNTETGELLGRIATAERLVSIGAGREDTHVYFIQRGTDGPIKIGASSNVVRRLAEIQIGAPEEMHLVGIWLFGGTSSERGLHRLHAADRLGGEWFAPTDDVWDSIRSFGGAA